MPLYLLVPSFRPLLAPVPRLRLRTDTHTQDNYRNPPAHARRGLIINTRAQIHVARSIARHWCLFPFAIFLAYFTVSWYFILLGPREISKVLCFHSCSAGFACNSSRLHNSLHLIYRCRDILCTAGAMLNLSFLGINHPLIRIYNNKDQDLWQNIIELIIKKIQLTCDIL